jgi:aryl-alcohol dehydrogenase-like predicted oxidoreductase
MNSPNAIKLALGTVQFGLPYGIANHAGQVTRAEAKAILQFALANGIDMLDTAIAYGDSEACLGEVGIHDFKLITKLPAVPDDCADISAWVQQQVRASLSRLGTDAVYGMLLHRPDQLLGPNGCKLYQALQALKCNGQVEKVGISIYSPRELAILTSQYFFDIVQAPFNLLDRRLYSTGWLQRLKDDCVEVHTRSAFLQGLLLMKKSDIPAKFFPWDGLWQAWHLWLESHRISAVHACLAFPLSFPEIDRVVVGAESITQLAQILSAENGPSLKDLPDLFCEDENLINPVNWNQL